MINLRVASQAMGYISTALVRTAINTRTDAQRRDLLPLFNRHIFSFDSGGLPASAENELNYQHSQLTKILRKCAFYYFIIGTTLIIGGMCLIALKHKIYVTRSLTIPNGELRSTGDLATSPLGFEVLGAGVAMSFGGSLILTHASNLELNRRAQRQLTRNHEV